MKKKSIAKNYVYNLLYEILAVIIPLITTPYLARVLGAENIGIYSYTVSITTYFILFGSLGISMYGKREIAYVQSNKKERSKVFWEIFLLRLVTLTISTVLFYFSFCQNNNYNIYYKILMLEIFANILDISWYFQGLEEFKKTVIRNTIVKTIGVICIFAFIKSRSDLGIYFLIYVLSTFFGNATLWMYLPKYIKRIKLSDLNVSKHIKPTMILFIPQIATQIYTVLDKTMIGVIVADKSEVGYYEQSQKIVKLLMTTVTSFGLVMMPRIAFNYAKGYKKKIKEYLDKSFTFILMLAFPLTLGICSTAYRFVPIFFGEGYDKVAPLLCIISPIIVLIGLSNVVGTQYLLPTKKQKKYTISVCLGAAVNFILNLILISKYQSIGAAIATVAAELVVTASQFLLIKDEISFKNVVKITYKYLLSAIIMFIVSTIIGNYLGSGVISLIAQIIISILVYFGFLILIKDSKTLEVVKKIKENKIIKIINFKSIIKYLILLLSIGSFIFIYFLIKKLDIIPDKYITLLFIVESSVIAVSIIMLLFKKKALTIISIILSIILIFINSFAYYYVHHFDKFIDEGFSGEIVDTTTFYVVTSSKNKINDVDLMGLGRNVDYYVNSKNIDLAQEKFGNYNYNEVEELNEYLINNKDNEFYLLIDKTNYTISFEFDKELVLKDYKIIYEFDVDKVEKRNVEVKETYNIFVMGKDFSNERNDLNMIITVNTITRKVLITSIPRDYYIPTYGHKYKDSFMVMGILGDDVVIKSVENYFGIKIDYKINVYTTNLVDIVDKIGGITYCSNMAYTTTHAQVIGTYNDKLGEKLYVKKGCQHLNGIQTLTVARERLAFKSGDRQRQVNCRKIMISIVKKILSTSTLTNYTSILSSFNNFYKTNMNRETMTTLLKSVITYGDYEILEQSVDGAAGYARLRQNTVTSDVVFPYESTVKKASSAIKKVINEK